MEAGKKKKDFSTSFIVFIIISCMFTHLCACVILFNLQIKQERYKIEMAEMIGSN